MSVIAEKSKDLLHSQLDLEAVRDGPFSTGQLIFPL